MNFARVLYIIFYEVCMYLYVCFYVFMANCAQIHHFIYNYVITHLCTQELQHPTCQSSALAIDNAINLHLTS